jgi:sulfur transfer protein SufE
MNHEAKDSLLRNKFLALDMWSHRAFRLVELGVDGEKMREKVRESLQRAQACLHACREALNDQG